MSSSTFSSELSPRAREIRVWLAIAAVLLLIELGARATIIPGTSDLGQDFADRARALVASPAPRIVFVGNSVTDRVRLDVVSDEWRALRGEVPSLEKFVTYDSNLSTWYRMSAQFFWKKGLKPDLIVVTYYAGNLLADSAGEDIGKLALYYTDAEDRASLFSNELRTLKQRKEYLLASLSNAYAARDRMRDAVLHVIPNYRQFATSVNSANYEYVKRCEAGAPAPAESYLTLASFLADARQAGVTICFVASPSRTGNAHAPYIISLHAVKMIADAGMLHLDLRRLPGISSDMFEDAVHLDSKGRLAYSRALAHAINETWKPQ